MRARRVKPKPHAVKQNYSYSVSELARCCGVHKNTVRNWRRDGLEPIDKARPVLFHGMTVRAFLRHRKARRTCPTPDGAIADTARNTSCRAGLGMCGGPCGGAGRPGRSCRGTAPGGPCR